MLVTHLSLVDFRNYSAAEVDVMPGPNLFVGSNGQGKTNLIEALGYLSTLSSHRVATDHALIRQGADSAIVRARLSYDDRTVLAELQLNRVGANRAQVNRSPIRTRDLPRYFSSVLFAPEDLALVRGEPSGRRRFLDELLVLRTPRLAGVLADYERVLKQRNSLLKSARAARVPADRLATLDIWDERLIDLGSELIVARSILIADLSPDVTDTYIAVAGSDHQALLGSSLTVDDSSTESDEDAGAGRVSDGVRDLEEVRARFRSALDRVRRSELERAITLIGPHRDDLVLVLNGMAARGFASHGESWSFALALKLASARLLRKESVSGDPVLILDDVFAELDGSRRGRLAEAIVGFEQVLITAAVLDDVPQALTGTTVHIEQGRILASPSR